jgi:soluble lytic murein transglycosylase-like protein
VVEKMKIIFICLVMLICENVQAAEINLNHIAQIESNFNPLAYNRGSGARGMYQITLVCLADYNQFHKAKLTKKQLFDPIMAREVANWYNNNRIPQLLRYYHKEVSTSNQLWAYNAGIGLVMKGIKPGESVRYINKYRQLDQRS